MKALACAVLVVVLLAVGYHAVWFCVRIADDIKLARRLHRERAERMRRDWWKG